MCTNSRHSRGLSNCSYDYGLILYFVGEIIHFHGTAGIDKLIVSRVLSISKNLIFFQKDARTGFEIASGDQA